MSGAAAPPFVSKATNRRFEPTGRIERPILGMIQDKDVCEERYTAVDLARAIYQRPRPNQAEHVAALRAMRSLMRKFPGRFVLSCGAARGPLRLEQSKLMRTQACNGHTA